MLVSSFVILISKIIENRIVFLCGLMLILQSMIHLALDSLVGGILWLYPFNSTAYTLIIVPARFGHWVLNFVFHWTFIIELGIVVLAIIAFFLRKQHQRANALRLPSGDARS